MEKKHKSGKSGIGSIELLQNMLEKVDDIVMLADSSTEMKIFYMNRAATKVLSEHRDSLNQALHGVDVASAMGNSIHQFHRDPARVRQILTKLGNRADSTHTADIPIGSVVFRTKTYPIFDSRDGGKISCYMASWKDVSADVALEETYASSAKRSVMIEDKITQIALAVTQLSATVSEIARSAMESSTLSTSVGENARRGEEVVGYAASAMREVASEIRKNARDIAELEQQTEEIDAIIQSITAIADQTNLLALNAAIEAARAGEFGRGFAVVADEVRALAVRARSSATEITTKITSVRAKTRDVVSSIDAAQSAVSQGEQRSDSAKAELSGIVAEIELIRDAIAGIASAAEQQSVMSSQISSDLHDVSESNSLGALSRLTPVHA